MTHGALHCGQFAPGKGKDLTHELPIQFQRAGIHLYCLATILPPQSTNMRLGLLLGVSFLRPPQSTNMLLQQKSMQMDNHLAEQ